MVELELTPSHFFHPDPYPRLWNWEELKQVVGARSILVLAAQRTQAYECASRVQILG